MEKYIKKTDVLAELKRRYEFHKERNRMEDSAIQDVLYGILNFLDSIEAKEVDTWHLQEKEDIYDAVKDWRLHTFACIMKDSSIQKFNGCCDEDCEGHINVHIDGVNDDYDNVDDIVKWIEYN